MLRPQVVATVLTSLVLVGFLVSGITAWMAPSSDVYAPHSYSGRSVGYRALYELASAFGQPVSRSTGVPDDLFRGPRRILLLQPSLFMLEREKNYLARLDAWLKDGGQIVVVARDLKLLGPKDSGEDPDAEDTPQPGEDDSPFDRRDEMRDVLGEDEFLARLGVSDVDIVPEPWSYDFGTGLDDFGNVTANDFRLFDKPPEPEMAFTPQVEGTFASLADGLKTLELPEDYYWFEGDGIEKAVGRVSIEGEDGESLPIVLEFERGQGRVTLVSDPTVLTNIGLGAADNAILGYRLAVGDGTREVVFDEYYHGALERIGATALLTVYPYGAVAASILAATLLWAWSHGIRFGTPVTHTGETRRSILEYIDAMARLFRRGRKLRFVLQTNREGLLDELRGALRLSHGTAEPIVLRRLYQVNPEAGRRLEDTLREVDQILHSDAPLPAGRLLSLQERLEKCRISKSRSLSPAPQAASWTSTAVRSIK